MLVDNTEITKTFSKHFAQTVENLNTQILKQTEFTFQTLTDCLNDAINKGVLPGSLTIANITPAHKKEEPTDKENYRPVSVLPLLSKVFEKLLYDQLSEYLEKYLNKL